MVGSWWVVARSRGDQAESRISKHTLLRPVGPTAGRPNCHVSPCVCSDWPSEFPSHPPCSLPPAGRSRRTAGFPAVRISKHTQLAAPPPVVGSRSVSPTVFAQSDPPSARRAFRLRQGFAGHVGGQALLRPVGPSAGRPIWRPRHRCRYPVSSRGLPTPFLHSRTQFAVRLCWDSTYRWSAPPAGREVRHCPHFDRSAQLTASIRYSPPFPSPPVTCSLVPVPGRWPPATGPLRGGMAPNSRRWETKSGTF